MYVWQLLIHQMEEGTDWGVLGAGKLQKQFHKVVIRYRPHEQLRIFLKSRLRDF